LLLPQRPAAGNSGPAEFIPLDKSVARTTLAEFQLAR
jgi:hypothetical protein